MIPILKYSIVLCFAINKVLLESSVQGTGATTPGTKKPGSLKEAKKFMAESDEKQLELINRMHLDSFEYNTNVTDYNKEIMTASALKYGKFYASVVKKSSDFKWKSFKDEKLKRWFLLFIAGAVEVEMATPSESQPASRNLDEDKTMDVIFNGATVCPYESKSSDNCTLKQDPDLIDMFRTNRKPIELRYYWKRFRDATGKKMKKQFLQHVKISNKAAQKEGFKDLGDFWVSQYESKSFVKDMADIMAGIKPLYEQLHAYVRRKLMKKYKRSHIFEDGPIPAHLMGNMYAQSWMEIFDIVDPYPKNSAPDLTEKMVKKKYKVKDLFKMAEAFYTSIGLKSMTKDFWKKSVIEKPEDREMVCHASAHNFYDKKDYRIKMCAKITEESNQVVVHEMGHIQYFMLGKNLPVVFQGAANPGFHEAIGDSMVLSITTTDYLKKQGFMEKAKIEEEQDISLLMKIGLKFIPTVPYAYIIDLYRYGVYNGSIKNEELNKMWWKYRLEYQGVCPPVRRYERDWDPGSKSHVATVVEYMRYFTANIFTFQIHKALCEEAGIKGPLHKCSLHDNKKAGALFKKMLELGRSVHWSKAMKLLTNGKTTKFEFKPLLEYFDPLLKWLKKENKGHTVGWKYDDVMSCPQKTVQTSSTPM